MDRTNPALRESVFKTAAAAGVGAQPMTVAGTVWKSIVLLAVTVFSAGWVWQATAANPAIAGPATLVGTLGGFVLALVAIFRPQSSPWVAPLYAALEGLALGAISAIYNGLYHGLPAMAVGLTCMVLLAMLVAYQTGLIRATDTVRRVVISATLGIALFYVLAMVLGLFHVRMPLLQDNGMLGLGLSVV